MQGGGELAAGGGLAAAHLAGEKPDTAQFDEASALIRIDPPAAHRIDPVS
jgi:hypothetical protein